MQSAMLKFGSTSDQVSRDATIQYPEPFEPDKIESSSSSVLQPAARPPDRSTSGSHEMLQESPPTASSPQLTSKIGIDRLILTSPHYRASVPGSASLCYSSRVASRDSLPIRHPSRRRPIYTIILKLTLRHVRWRLTARSTHPAPSTRISQRSSP